MTQGIGTPNAGLESLSADGKKGIVQRVLSLISRGALGHALGISFGGKRNLYEAFGWDTRLTDRLMWEMYARGGIAHRIVHAYPDAVWGRPPQLYVKDNPAWNDQWDEFASEFDLWSTINRLDVLRGLGRYSVLLVGSTSSNLASPLRRGTQITFLQPYAETHVRPAELVKDPNNPRFGLPEYYILQPGGFHELSYSPTGTQEATPTDRTAIRVHHTRVLHITRKALVNPLYGIPEYAPIWNYLTDLLKVVGSSAESYWKTAYQGMHADVDTEMDLSAEDEANFAAEIDEWEHGFRRFIRTRGVKVTPLGTTVADPRGSFETLLTLISGTTGIPKRILLGSEAGQLASNQDRNNWAERVEEYRSTHAVPNILKPLLRWLLWHTDAEIQMSDVQVLWPEAFRLSPVERGQQSAQTARTLVNIARALGPITLTPGRPEQTLPDGTVIPAEPGEIMEPLITRDEARRIVGLSTDQTVLLERPEEDHPI